MTRRKSKRDEHTFDADPLWYKDAVIYELHVRSFFDSDGDGIGDFRGLTEKLDYIQDLGVTAVWLLPFYPSPLKDDGYDISDYTSINPPYGELRDLRTFIREAHQRGLRVITELVMNHTSDRHEWFQRARRAPPESRHRDFYVWSDRPDKYSGVRIIFTDTETSNWAWDPVANAYYWHRFYTHQPDLNFESDDVQRAMLRVVDFWFGLGVDGLRLDAIPYLYEREGTSCENLPETHAFLKKLRAHIDANHSEKMLLAEANQWPDDAVAYFGDGDECHTAFHFPIMPRLFMSLRMEDRYPIIEILEQTPDIPENCQWAVFLRNHDELTLEMVTDEDRDYMYRVYAQDKQARINLGIRRRLAPLLGNARRRIELMNGLLLSLPGTPIVYYGDEIGMGDNIYQGDRNGVRTPMQWNGDRNAGFSRANPQQLFLPVIIDPEYHYETVNVEAQQANPHSLLWWMKRTIALRKRHQAFGRGTLEFLHPENRKVIAFLRRHEDECILIVANLSRFVQAVELDLAELEGCVPIEMFGHTEFPAIRALPYFVTLGPHGFYWFSVEQPRVAEGVHSADALPTLTARGSWESLLTGKAKEGLEAALPEYVKARRWFGGKGRQISAVNIADAIPVSTAEPDVAYATLVNVSYTAHESETYFLPLAFASGQRADELLAGAPQAAVARVFAAETEGILYDATWHEGFTTALVNAMGGRRRFAGGHGRLVASATRAFRGMRPRDGEVHPEVMQVDQSNTSVAFGTDSIFKLMRRLEPGINPDLEIGRYLTEQRFEHVPAIAGALEYVPTKGEPITLAILQGFVRNEGNAWEYTLDALSGYFERVLSLDPEGASAPSPPPDAFSDWDIDQSTVDLVGPYLESARQLGGRTAELHVALAAGDDADFVPELVTDFHIRSLYQSMRSLASKNFQLLRKQSDHLSDHATDLAAQALALEDDAQERFRRLLDRPIGGKRIRCHGDYHLGQVLFTGKDFVIIDFEGEPARSLGERRLKRPPLRDVAGMLRSFHYAGHVAIEQHRERGFAEEGDAALEPWITSWYSWVSAVYLREYLATPGIAALMPAEPEHVKLLLEAFLLDKATYEVGYELNNRPEWVHIPLAGLLQILGMDA